MELEITQASRLEFYANIKKEYMAENYLKYDNRKVRRVYTRYRVSDHNL